MKIRLKRRHFLIGGGVVAGAGVFGLIGLEAMDSHERSRAAGLTAQAGEGSFGAFIKIAPDDTVTLYSPHIDFGQGSQTTLAQMMADELDAAWAHVRVEQAPADPAFANWALARGFEMGTGDAPLGLTGITNAFFGAAARQVGVQVTGGSTAVRMTGQLGIRKLAAAARASLVATAASRLGVGEDELTTANGVVSHAKSGKSLRYGELAEDAAGRSLASDAPLKTRKDYRLIGKPMDRLDLPGKVNGSAQYGIDFHLPGMKVATVMAAPVRGGKLQSVDPAPAMAVKGVTQVVKLDDAVVVVANGYWPALKGLRALAPKFSDGGNGGYTTASIFADQAKLFDAAKPDAEVTSGDVAGGLADKSATHLTAEYRVPFLHQAMMEPFAMTAHYSGGKLEVWGASQDPLAARMAMAKAADLAFDDVTFHPMIMGGGFGRRFPDYQQILTQLPVLAKQVDGPVKLIWSREEDVKQGAYRPQSSARLQAAVKGGKIIAWRNDYVQNTATDDDLVFPYALPAAAHRHHQYITHIPDAYFRSVNGTQHGFYVESFMDELAHATGADPYQFRRAHLAPGSRELAVLDAAAKLGGWGTPLAAGTGRGIALVMSFGSIVAHVTEASLVADGKPKVHKVTAVVDCGTVIDPRNAEAQVKGAVIMGLSTAIGEAITMSAGAVDQSSFPDYPVLKLADAPEIAVHFIDNDEPPGGLGEPGLPPAAPALANALFAATGKRWHSLPLVGAKS